MSNLIDIADGASKKLKKQSARTESENLRVAMKLTGFQKDKEKCEFERFANVDRFMDGKLDKEEYQRIRVELSCKAETLDGKIAELQAKLHEGGGGCG